MTRRAWRRVWGGLKLLPQAERRKPEENRPDLKSPDIETRLFGKYWDNMFRPNIQIFGEKRPGLKSPNIWTRVSYQILRKHVQTKPEIEINTFVKFTCVSQWSKEPDVAVGLKPKGEKPQDPIDFLFSLLLSFFLKFLSAEFWCWLGMKEAV